MREMLRGLRAEDLMTRNFETVSGDLSLQDLVEGHILGRHRHTFVVADAGRLEGVVGLGDIKKVAREQWASTTIRQAMTPREDLEVLAPDDDGNVVLQRLSEKGVGVLMFSQSLSEHSLNLVVREQDQAHCLKILCREFENGDQDSVCNLGTKEKVATISVVGVPGWNKTGIVSHAFSALGKHSTRVIAVAQAATEYSVSFCIPEDQVADAVCFLHRELGLEGKGE